MAVDYRNYKTPHYEITIYSPDFSRSAQLPTHILKLVQSVEIQESFMSGLLNTGGNTFKMSILEGSREPASQNAALGTAGLYSLKDASGSVDTQISGSITNRTGSIVDLRFSGSAGITFTTAEEKATNTVDDSVQINVVGSQTTRTYKNEQKAPKYLFEYKNKVKITWGYLENWPISKRTMIFDIVQIETIFADTGPTIVNISGTDLLESAHKISPSGGGIPFGEVTTTQSGDLINFVDSTTESTLKKICNSSGWDYIISTGLPSDTYDRNRQKIWLSGQSFHEFLNKLAKLNDAYVQFINDPQTHKTLLVFMKKSDFEAKSVIKDPSLLIYKSPGSLIRSVNVNIDFSGQYNTAVANVTSQAQNSQQQTDVTSSQTIFTGEHQISVDPSVSDPGIKSLKNGLLGGMSVSKKEISPVENQGFQGGLASTLVGDGSRIVEITVDMIGYPRLIPGVVTLGGLGVRYSGKYRILSVEHRIDENGYDTKFHATTFSLPTGGLTPPNSPKGQPDQNVDQSLFAPEQNTQQSSPTPRDQLTKKLVGQP